MPDATAIPQAPAIPRLALTRAETAESLGISVATLDTLCRNGEGPPSTRLGDRGVRFPVASLERWLEQRATEVAEDSHPTEINA